VAQTSDCDCRLTAQISHTLKSVTLCASISTNKEKFLPLREFAEYPSARNQQLAASGGRIT